MNWVVVCNDALHCCVVQVGRVEVYDGDLGDSVSLTVTGPFSRVCGVSERGEIFIKDLGRLQGSTAHLVVVAEDSGSPPRRASVPVVVTVAEAALAPRQLQESQPAMLIVVLRYS